VTNPKNSIVNSKRLLGQRFCEFAPTSPGKYSFCVVPIGEKRCIYSCGILTPEEAIGAILQFVKKKVEEVLMGAGSAVSRFASHFRLNWSRVPILNVNSFMALWRLDYGSAF
jgi:hypothetical protein